MVYETESLWIKTTYNYQQRRWQPRFMYGKCNKTARCQVDLFVNLIMCGYYFRGFAQQEETLKGKERALREMRNADEDEAQFQKLDEEQEARRKRYRHQEWELYN